MSEAPPARPSGSEGDVRDPGKTGLTHGAEPTLTATSSMRQEGAGPLFQNSPSIRDVGGASGAALRVGRRRPRSREDATRTRGGAHAYGDLFHEARGGRPPLPELPLYPGCRGRLRRGPPGPKATSAIPGRRDSYAGRSPRLRRPLPRGKRGQAPSSRTPPLSGMSGAPPARPSGSEGDVRDPGKTGLIRGAEPTLTATSSTEARGGRPPLPELPLYPGCRGRLRRGPSGLRATSAIPGRRDSYTGRSPRLRRPLPRRQEGAGPLFQNSPSIRDVGGASGAALRV